MFTYTKERDTTTEEQKIQWALEALKAWSEISFK
jgi:hypothetical protein